MVRIRLDLAYDGTDFRGFASNPGVRTVAGELIAATARVLGEPVQLTCAGRTDAGVHAAMQVVTFDVADQPRVPLDRLQHAINAQCGPEIVVARTSVVAGSFDARFSATGRTYRYTVLNRAQPDPFLARTSWHVAGRLDRQALHDASRLLLGEHDFSSFCRRRMVADAESGRERPASMVRTVRSAEWDESGDGLLRFEIEASSFCHQMVRSLVGTLVDIGIGRRLATSIPETLAARDRAAAGRVAPPHGLCLWSVAYDPPGSDGCD